MKKLIYSTHKVNAVQFFGIVLGTIAAIAIIQFVTNCFIYGIH